MGHAHQNKNKTHQQQTYHILLPVLRHQDDDDTLTFFFVTFIVCGALHKVLRIKIPLCWCCDERNVNSFNFSN